MRVTGGRFRGRILHTTPGLTTRPTTDKVRQSIFNVLMHELEGAEVLDLFAGSGALGIDALSRGAASAVFVESGFKQVAAIKKNLHTLGLEQKILPVDYCEACRLLAAQEKKFTLIFADPPYEEIAPLEVAETVIQYDLLSSNGLLIIEHKSGLNVDSDKLTLLKKRKFGQTEVSFYAAKK